jgi:hypothetical protein
VVKVLRYKSEGRWSIQDGVMEFFIDINPSDRTMVLGVDTASNRDEYQKYFLGVNAAGA